MYGYTVSAKQRAAERRRIEGIRLVMCEKERERGASENKDISCIVAAQLECGTERIIHEKKKSVIGLRSIARIK